MTTATTAAASQTDKREPALPFRGDTLLGVCEAIGQDLGVNPTWLRVAFASLLLWNAEVVVIAYIALGVVVAVTRWLFPDRRPAPSAELGTPESEKAEAPLEDRKDREEELLAA